MYRLMKSERFVLENLYRPPVVLFRQKEVDKFAEAALAITACESFNSPVDTRHYVLNADGKELYAGRWIG
jgi:hypothetical protein